MIDDLLLALFVCAPIPFCLFLPSLLPLPHLLMTEGIDVPFS